MDQFSRQVPDTHRLVIQTETQADNEGGQGWRECFSSTCAAIARYHNAVRSDNEYNRIRRKYGDTTNPQAQIMALQKLGLQAQFRTNASINLLMREVWNGRPVAVGWIHQGPISRPVGTGHWSVVAGYSPTALWSMDPNGEPDLLRGGYVTTGRGWQGWVTMQNFSRRWEVVPNGQTYSHRPRNGWALTIAKPNTENASAAAA